MAGSPYRPAARPLLGLGHRGELARKAGLIREIIARYQASSPEIPSAWRRRLVRASAGARAKPLSKEMAALRPAGPREMAKRPIWRDTGTTQAECHIAAKSALMRGLKAAACGGAADVRARIPEAGYIVEARAHHRGINNAINVAKKRGARLASFVDVKAMAIIIAAGRAMQVW